MARSKVTVEMKGPLFSADVEKVFGDNLVDMLQAVADEGAEQVRRQIGARAGSMPYSTGWTSRTVKGRVSSINGRKWHRHAVVSANTAGMDRNDAIRTKAAAAGIERRWHHFRKVASASRRAIRNADLTKGLN